MARSPFPSLRLFALCLLLPLSMAGCYNLTGQSGDDDTVEGDDDATGDDDDAGGDDDDDSGSTGDDDDDDSSASGDDDSQEDPFGLQCSPELTTLAATYGVTTDVQLSAAVVNEDGSTVPAEGETWTVLNGFGGSVDANGLYTTPSDHGGAGEVQVSLGSESDTCAFEITMEGEINEAGDSNLSGSAGSATTTADDGCAADFIYPINGSIMPGAMVPPVFQWDAAAGANMYVLQLSSEWTNFTVYTSSTSWTPSTGEWGSLTTFDPGTEVEATLLAGNWNGSAFSGGLCQSTVSYSLEVSDYGITGTVFYWSPAAFGGGIKRIDIGSNSNSAVSFPGTSMGACVGCHNANLGNPSRISVVEFGGFDPNNPLNMNPVSIWDINTGSPTQVQGGSSGLYGALNNDGTRLIRSPMLTTSGALELENAATGSGLGTVPVQTPAVFPNWSADGTKVVYSHCDSTESSSSDGGSSASQMSASGCSLRIIEANSNDTFGTDSMLLESDGVENLYYPALSPDGDWVVYNRAATGDSYANPLAELWIISASGGTPIRLDNANLGDGLTNSWPRWSPDTGDYSWVAVSSKRDYGNVAPSPPSQIWLSAIDLSQAASGLDPSHPPVWLPGQSTSEDGHTPVWVPRYIAR